MRAFAPAIGGSLVAVLVAVAIIVAVNVFRGGSTGGGSPVVSVPPPTSSAVLSRSVTPSPTVTPRPSTPVTIRPATPPPALHTPPPAATPLTVFNLARISQYALLARSRLRAAGYPVPVLEFRPYGAPASLVYFDPGNASQQAAARALVARHLGLDAALPRPASVPAAGGLIVLVTASYR